MSTRPLPERPDLDHLRRQARALQRDVRDGVTDAVGRVAHQYGAPDDRATFPLSTAQLVVAREYGFASWGRLKKYVDVATTYRWDVHDATEPDEEARRGDPAEAFCRLACLTYSDVDGPRRWAAASALLAERPEICATNIWAAAAAGRLDDVDRLLGEDADLARRHGGPYGWTPLFYLAYSRAISATSGGLATARRLLDGGADPNEGYLWNGLPYPFTLLAGAFGEGELGPKRQPRHPDGPELARLLLEAGADPNDSQALYNRMFECGDDHLELLFSYGLGRGDGGPWKARLGEAIAAPAELLRYQLWWAIEHGMTDRIRLLVRHGVDVVSAYDDERTPLELARLGAWHEVADVLREAGAVEPELAPDATLVGAAFAGDRGAVERIVAAYPEAVDAARDSRPGLVVWATANGRIDTVRLLAELGWDVGALGRGDALVDGAHATALHYAAADGRVELARLLLELGADPNARDLIGHDATPLQWAAHFEQPETVELLTPLTD